MTPGGPTTGSRVVGPADAAAAVEVLVGAFYADPLWSWAFPDDERRRDQHRRLWGVVMDGALRYPWVRATPDLAAVAVWIPPGGTELAPEVAERFAGFVADVAGPHADRALAALEAFERAHPTGPPHYYLSLLGTDPAHLGRGLGLGLLEDNLRDIDAEGAAAYLESSHPGNVPLYQRHGFEPRDTIRVGSDGPEVVTMWREPRA